MHQSRVQNGDGQTFPRMKSMLCLLGICYATWRGLEILTTRFQAARVLPLEAEVRKGRGLLEEGGANNFVHGVDIDEMNLSFLVRTL